MHIDSNRLTQATFICRWCTCRLSGPTSDICRRTTPFCGRQTSKQNILLADAKATGKTWLHKQMRRSVRFSRNVQKWACQWFLLFGGESLTSIVKPQTHGEREARSYKNFCAQESDITISLALWTTDKCCKSSKLGTNRFISRRLARDTERDMYSYGKSLHASRFSPVVCLQHYSCNETCLHKLQQSMYSMML